MIPKQSHDSLPLFSKYLPHTEHTDMSQANTTPVVTDILNISGQTDCPICLEVIEPEVNCCLTNCSHAFHTSCLIQLAAAPRRRHTAILCPYCRGELFKIPNSHSIELSVLLQDKTETPSIQYHEYFEKPIKLIATKIPCK